MVSNSKAKCVCPRRPSKNSLEPCIPNPNPSFRRMPQRIRSPSLRGHAMNNPEILSSIRNIDHAIRGPICPNASYDCSKTQQKTNYNHPLYQKWNMKTDNTENYPVHYNIPPVDYRTYLQRQNQQICSKHGSDFEKKCRKNPKDLEKVRCYEEFQNRNRKNKPSGVCPHCKAIKSMNNLPHCCSCRCAHYQKLGWQNINPAIQQGQKLNGLEERRSSHLKSLLMKKSSICQTQGSAESKHDCNLDQQVGAADDELQCPCGPMMNPKSNPKLPIPLTEYQASYQYHLWDHLCREPSKSTKLTSNKNNLSESWKYSIKPEENKYEPSLAAAEAKLELLERLCFESQIDDYIQLEQRKRASLSRKDHPKDNIRRTLLDKGWGPGKLGSDAEKPEV